MSRKRPLGVAVALCAAVALSCSDPSSSFEPVGSGSVFLMDASTGGNPHFHFLQPLGLKNAGGNPGGWAPGTSNIQTLSPTVEILCVNACNAASNVTFSGSSVQVFASHYQADVSGNNVPLTLNGLYRITVWLDTPGGQHELGMTEHVIADNAQRNLSVKFRIEDGALCYEADGSALETCGTGTIDPNEGGYVTVTDEENNVVASLLVTEGFRSVPTTFLFTRLDDLPCLDTNYAQFEGCFSLTLNPALEEGELFAEGSVWVGYCLDPRVRVNYVEKYKSPDKVDGVLQGGIQALFYEGNVPHIPHDANLDCTEFQPTPGTSVIAAATHRVKRALRTPLAFVFGGKVVADDLTRYGGIRDASRFGHARKLTTTTSSGSGLTGQPVALSAVVRYFASQNARDAGLGNHHNDYVSALPVAFRLQNGPELCSAWTGGTSDPSNGLNPNLPQTGTATCTAMFATAGTYVVVPNVDGRDYDPFTVTATQWLATFLTPLSNSNPSALAQQLTTGSGVVRVTCSGAPGQCSFGTLDLPYTASNYKGGKYQVGWKIAGATPGALLTFQVLLGPTPLPYVSQIVVASEPKFNVGSNLPIAWRIERP